MQLTHGRLKAALIAGKIPVTDQALAVLQAGLVTIARGYHLNKVLRAVKNADRTQKRTFAALPGVSHFSRRFGC
jgi:hypothetical protein